MCQVEKVVLCRNSTIVAECRVGVDDGRRAVVCSLLRVCSGVMMKPKTARICGIGSCSDGGTLNSDGDGDGADDDEGNNDNAGRSSVKPGKQASTRPRSSRRRLMTRLGVGRQAFA